MASSFVLDFFLVSSAMSFSVIVNVCFRSSSNANHSCSLTLYTSISVSSVIWWTRKCKLNQCLEGCSNEANIVKHCWANNAERCWTKIFSKFKLKPTSSNIIQSSVQKKPTCCIQQCWTCGPTCWLRVNRPYKRLEFLGRSYVIHGFFARGRGGGGAHPANDELMHFYARNICEINSLVANLI